MNNKYTLTEHLQNFFGFDRFKGQQEEAVKNVLSGKNTFVLMPTGGGKSLIYQLPALILDGTAIIISPLIALMKNQVDSIRGMHQEDNVAHFLNSSLSKTAIQEVKNDVLLGKTKLLYVAPESLTKEENIEFFKKVKGEMTHTTWPTRKQTINYTLIVILISFAVAYYLGLFDYIFSQILGKLL